MAGFAIVRTMKNKPNRIFTWCATGVPRKKSWIAFQVQLKKIKLPNKENILVVFVTDQCHGNKKALDVKTLTVNNGTMLVAKICALLNVSKELNKGTWICSECALPNYNSADSLLISTKDEDDCNSALLSLGSPLASSTPTQLHHNLQ